MTWNRTDLRIVDKKLCYAMARKPGRDKTYFPVVVQGREYEVKFEEPFEKASPASERGKELTAVWKQEDVAKRAQVMAEQAKKNLEARAELDALEGKLSD